MVTIRENTINMKMLVIVAIVLFAIMGITEFHRVNYIDACHSRGGETSTKLYFFNECGYWTEEVTEYNPDTNEDEVTQPSKYVRL